MYVETDLKKAEWLFEAKVFCVDIETETEVPEDSKWAAYGASDGDTYGVSYVTDMTVISFYHPDHNPVIVRDPYSEESMAFVRKVFDRDHYTVIGHNVLFDLRHLGGHLGFDLLREGIKVWDTLRMSLLLMLGRPSDSDKKGRNELGLEAQTVLHALYRNENEMRFHNAMKAYRSRLSKMDEILEELPASHIIWRFMGGKAYNTPQELKRISQDVVDIYVTLDTIYTYLLYEVHLEFIERVSKEDVEKIVYGRNPENLNEIFESHTLKIPKWPKIKELVDWEQRISWASAVQSIRGVQFNIPYAEQELARSREESEEHLRMALTVEDPTHAEDEWEEKFQMVWWYHRILETLRNKATYTPPGSWIHWSFHELSLDFLKSVLVFDTIADTDEDDDDRRTLWAEWLLSIEPGATRGKIFGAKTLPNPDIYGSAPYIDILEYVKVTSDFGEATPTETDYLTLCKYEWFKAYYTQPVKLGPLDGLAALSKKPWAKYHLFVVCGVKIPDERTIRTNPSLTTMGLIRKIKANPKMRDSDFSQRDFVMSMNLLAVGKDAVDYYLSDQGGGTEAITHYRQYQDTIAQVRRLTQYLAHASRDGRIHTTIPSIARTSRGRSSAPNLQNLPMADKQNGFRGFMMGERREDIKRRLVEYDLSNAENVHGAVLSGDRNFALAVMSSDFHSVMRDSYWPELIRSMKEAGDTAGLKKYRNMSKPITFGNAYGAGVAKIAASIGCTFQEAQEIVDNIARSFPEVDNKKKEIERRCKQRVSRGYYPAFVTLWDGTRVQVESEPGQINFPTYPTWNYSLQGGIGRIVARARAELVEWEITAPKGPDGLPECYQATEIHDALIGAVIEDQEKYEAYSRMVIDRLCKQIPQSALRKTVPEIRYVAESGPENAEKWGWLPDESYPFDVSTFINRWGVWELPESDLEKPVAYREAPSWKGPLHEGWDVEKEISAWHHKQEEESRKEAALEKATESGGSVRVAKTNKEWRVFAKILNEAKDTLSNLEGYGQILEDLQGLRTLEYLQDDGTVSETAPLDLANYLLAASTVRDMGHPTPEFDQTASAIHQLLEDVEGVVAVCNLIKAWMDAYPEHLPDTRTGEDPMKSRLGTGGNRKL